MINVKTAFGVIGDGSDETAKINDVFAASGSFDEGEYPYFPPGVYGLDGPDQIAGAKPFMGAGYHKTQFKNLSPTARLFDIQPSPGPGLRGGDFTRFSGFSIDQNGCSGSAIILSRQYNGLRDVMIYNQGGGVSGQAAIKATNATLADLDNVHVYNSDNCIELTNCVYVNAANVSLERGHGFALKADTCPSLDFTHLYLDNGNGAGGFEVGPLMTVINTTTANFNGLHMEMGLGGTLPAGKAYNLFQGSSNINVRGARLNHTLTMPSSYMFYLDDSCVNFDGVEWIETRIGMILFGAKGANSVLSARNIVARNSASGSHYGVGIWDGPVKRVIIDNWINKGNTCPVYIGAAVQRTVSNCDAPVILT